MTSKKSYRTNWERVPECPLLLQAICKLQTICYRCWCRLSPQRYTSSTRYSSRHMFISWLLVCACRQANGMWVGCAILTLAYEMFHLLVLLDSYSCTVLHLGIFLDICLFFAATIKTVFHGSLIKFDLSFL